MKKVTLREKLQYGFDNLMSKGTASLVAVLFGATALVILLVALALSLLDGSHPQLGENAWASLMHIIDAGTITGADTEDVTFVVLMSLATLCGLFVTSILIGIITSGFEEKLDALKKGNSRVIETNHTVILGFDYNTFTVISELVEANENQKSGCIVILSPDEKETVEELVSQGVPDLKNTRIICRTGAITDGYMLEKCSLETARSIIINSDQDFLTVKAILTINNYFASLELENPPHIVATIRTQANYDAIQIIDQGNVELLLVEDTISRIIAQTCRQPGLSNVLVELFDYDGDELYFESFDTFAGKAFGDTLNAFEKAVVFGYQRKGEVVLNPHPSALLEQGDKLILLVEDDGMAKPGTYSWDSVAGLESNDAIADAPENILIIGQNGMLDNIVTQLDEYFCKGSCITVADSSGFDALADIQTNLKHIEMNFRLCDINNHAVLEELTRDGVSHILLLSSDDCDTETADALTLLQLIHLRNIAQTCGRTYTITSEMQDVSNQKLAQATNTNDLVVGSNIINLISTQISENRSLAVVFRELLQAEGSEIYIRKASNFVKLHTEMDFYQVTELLKARNQVAVGYKKQGEDGFEIVVNPLKSDKIVFTEEDAIIALAED